MGKHILNNKFPIETSRLLIRPIEVDDAEALLEYKRESWDALLEWLIWVHPPSIEERTIDDERSFCQSFEDRNMKGTDLICVAYDKVDHRLIGSGGLHGLDLNENAPNLGFNVRSTEIKKGYATEIAEALCKFAFNHLGAESIKAAHAEGNEGSKKVLKKIGFQDDKVLKGTHQLVDEKVNEYHYRLNR